MATATSLKFSVTSSWDGKGIQQAQSAITKLKADIEAMSDSRLKLTAELEGIEEAKAKVDELSAQTHNVKLEASISGVEEAKAQLDEAAKGRNTDIKANADTMAAKSEIDEAAKDRDTKIQAKADTATATTQIDFAVRERSVIVKLKTDSSELSKAGSEIEQIMSNMSSQATKAMGGLSSDMSAASSSAGGLASSAMGVKVALAAVAVISLAPLIAEFAQAAGIIALYPAALMGVAGVAATVKLGISGISDAFKAAATDQKNAVQSYQNVSNAQQSVADTARAGALAIRTANEQSVSANQSLVTSQQQVAQAYKDAQRNLEDLQMQQSSSGDNIESASIAVQRAKDNISAPMPQGTRDPVLEMRDRYNQLALAQDHYRDTILKAQQTNQDYNEAQSKGVEGSNGVVNAKVSQANAQQSAQDAASNVARAIQQAAENNAKAAQALQDAQRQANTLQTALAKLAPAAQDFVQKMLVVKQQLVNLGRDVQQNLFAGMGTAFSNVATHWMPTISAGLTGIATQINSGVKKALADLDTQANRSTVSKIFDNIKASIKPVIDGIGNIIQGFLNLAGIGSSFLPGLSSGFDNVTGKFKDWTADTTNQNKFKKFIQDSIDAVTQLFNLMLQVGRIFGAIFSALSGGGPGSRQDVTKSAVDDAKSVADYLYSPKGQQGIVDFFSGLKDFAHDIKQAFQDISTVVGAINKILPSGGSTDKSAPGTGTNFPGRGVTKWIFPDQGSQQQKDQAWSGAATRTLPGNPKIGDGSGTPHLPGTMNSTPDNKTNFDKIMDGMSTHWSMMWIGMKSIGSQTWDAMQTGWAATTQWFSSKWDTTSSWVSQHWSSLWNGTKTEAGSIWASTTSGWNSFTGSLESGWTSSSNWISQHWSMMWIGVKTEAGQIWGSITAGWNSFTSGFKSSVSGLVTEIGSTFSKIVGAFTDPLKKIFDFYNNTIGKILPSLKINYDGGGNSAPAPVGGGGGVYGFADGGQVPGQGHRRADDVPAMLSSKEFVVNADDAQNNLSVLHHINNGGAAQAVQKFADGGQVGDNAAITRALGWVSGMNGQMYNKDGWIDCSGLASGVYDELLGRAPKREFTTVSNFPSLGFVPGTGGVMEIGVTPLPGSLGHMAITLAGHKLESGGVHDNIAIDGPAIGADDGQFKDHYYLPGQLFSPPYTGTGAQGSGGKSGGFLGMLGSAVSGLVNGVQGGAADLFTSLTNPILGAIPSPIPGIASPAGDLVKQLATQGRDGLANLIRGHESTATSSGAPFAGTAIPSAEHKAIIDQAVALAGGPAPNTLEEWESGFETLVQREAGWNAAAINNWDSNAAAGHPSKGLGQMIDSTFEAHKVPGHDNIWSPVDNLASDVGYIKSRYGGITNVQQANAAMAPKGYADGTNSAAPGWAMVGETGPELVNFHGGETVIPTNQLSNQSLLAQNGVPAGMGTAAAQQSSAYNQQQSMLQGAQGIVSSQAGNFQNALTSPIDQFGSDIGIGSITSGSGFFSQLVKQGIQYGSKIPAWMQTHGGIGPSDQYYKSLANQAPGTGVLPGNDAQMDNPAAAVQAQQQADAGTANEANQLNANPNQPPNPGLHPAAKSYPPVPQEVHFHSNDPAQGVREYFEKQTLHILGFDPYGV